MYRNGRKRTSRSTYHRRRIVAEQPVMADRDEDFVRNATAIVVSDDDKDGDNSTVAGNLLNIQAAI